MARIGIFGGHFSPLHNGHVNSLQTVLKKMELDQLIVVPAYKSPNRGPTQGPSPEQRLQMVQQGLAGLNGKITVSDIEIKRGGISYSIDTLRQLQLDHAEDELFLIIGADQLHHFDEWKQFSEIFDIANLVVTSRPEAFLPRKKTDLQPDVSALIEEFSGTECLLSSGKHMFFVRLDDVEVSGTELRRLMRSEEEFSEFVPEAVSKYIKEHNFYQPLSKSIGDYEKFCFECAQFLQDKKALGVNPYDLREIDQPSEFSLIASGTSTRHASALAEGLLREVKTRYGVFPQSTEGLKEGRWVVLDYGSLIVHIFYDFTRQEYRLEELWKKGKKIEL